ncbi:MAG: hypothetical protein ACI959_000883 [Limisphaerales bacterium]
MKIYTTHFLISGFIALLFAACTSDKAPAEEPIARAFDAYLYPTDVASLAADELNPNDSAVVVSEFIDQWIKHQLILEVAESNLTARGTAEQIELQAENYRETLLIEAYIRQWISQELDTLVKEEESSAFYEMNNGQFKLKEDIYKIDYISSPEVVVNFDSIRFWFDNLDRYSADLDRFCATYNIEQHTGEETWFSLTDLHRLLPDAEIQESDLKGKKILEFRSRSRRFLMHVESRKIKGSEAPLAYVSLEIEQRILHQRRKELVKSTYRNLYLEGGKRNQYEIYK